MGEGLSQQTGSGVHSARPHPSGQTKQVPLIPVWLAGQGTQAVWFGSGSVPLGQRSQYPSSQSSFGSQRRQAVRIAFGLTVTPKR